ncbi:MAG: AAA family ATPase [Desulfuromonadaceae bacterium]
MPQYVVTIERMVACAGLVIGRRVAELLAIPCLDQEILTRAARQLKQDEQELAGRDERLLSFGRKLLAAFSAGSPDTEYAPPPFPFPEDDELFAAEKKVILDAVHVSGAVIIGHGGGAILQELPKAVRIFCHAPLEYRTRRLMKIYHLDDERAARLAVTEQDRARERYLRSVTGRNWQDMDQYDLCIDTSKIEIEKAADIIAGVARHKHTLYGGELR